MSIVRSTKLVSLTSNRTSRSIPIDHNYNRVCQYNLVPSEKDISAIFKASRDYYYRKALESVGNGSSRSDYKHYRQDESSHPSCNCILCWTYRRSLKPIDYPTVRAKLLCLADQLREEYVSVEMQFDYFERLTAQYAKLTRDMNVALWEILFPGKDINEGAKDVIFEIKEEIRKGVDLTINLTSFPPSEYKPQIKKLQKRADREYELRKGRDNLRLMTPEQVEEAHQKMLRIDQTKGWFINLDESLVKEMFLHDFILEKVKRTHEFNVPGRVGKNRTYARFEGVRSDYTRYNIFLSRISRANALIKASLHGFYFHVPELRNEVQKQYRAFSEEFVEFLKEDERKKFATLVEVSDLKDLPESPLTEKYIKFHLKCKTKYMIQKVEMELEKHKKKTDAFVMETVNGLYHIHELRLALETIRLEKSLLMGRIEFGPPAVYMKCTVAIENYIQTLWDQSQSPTRLFGYEEKLAELIKLKENSYREACAERTMQNWYSKLGEEWKRKVAKLRTQTKYDSIIKFMKFFGVEYRDLEVTDYTQNTQYSQDEYEQMRLTEMYITRFSNLALEAREKLGRIKRKKRKSQATSSTGSIDWKKMNHIDKRWELHWNFYENRKKKWQLAMELMSDDQKQEAKKMLDEIYQQSLPKSIEDEARTEARTELCLLSDIFHSLNVSSELMDKFLLDRLTPDQSTMFRTLKQNFEASMPVSSESKEHEEALEQQFQEQREPFKQIVFGRILQKRAINRELRRLWEREKARQRARGEQAQGNLNEQQRWIGFKYHNKLQWLAENARVFVYIDFNKHFQSTQDDEAVEAVGEDSSAISESMRRFEQRAKAIKKQEDDNKTSGIKMCWVQKIDENKVLVKFRDPIRNGSKKISEFLADIDNVYDNAREYKIMIEYKKHHAERIRQEKSDRAKLLKLREARREFVRSITHAELIEQRQAEGARALEDEAQRMVFDDETKGERLELFKKWTSYITTDVEYRNMGKRRNIPEAIIKEYEKKPYLYLMFTDGRKQWEEENDILRKDPPGTFNSSNPRSRDEQDMVNAANRIKRYCEDQDKRNISNKWTRYWFKFIMRYGKNSRRPVLGGGDSGIDPNMKTRVLGDLLELIGGKPPEDGIKEMETFKEEWKNATDRANKRALRAWEKYKERGKSNGLSRRKKLLCEDVLKFADEIIADIKAPEKDPRMRDKSPKIVRYIKTELDAHAERILKTPLQIYTLAMWKKEVELSFAELEQPVWEELKKFVELREDYEYPDGDGMTAFGKITEYDRTFLAQVKNKKPVLPFPLARDLRKKELKYFQPRSRSSRVRIAFGPGSWYKLDETSDMMRVTGLTMEERLSFNDEIKKRQDPKMRSIDYEKIVQQNEAVRVERSKLQGNIYEIDRLLSTDLSIADKVELLYQLKSFEQELKTVDDFKPAKTEMELAKDINNHLIDWKERKRMIELNINRHFNRSNVQAKKLKAKKRLDDFKEKLKKIKDKTTDIRPLFDDLVKLYSELEKSGNGNKKWKESDGNGTLHIIDDCVGDFKYYENDILIRNPTKDDFPTHLRLNCVWYDTKAGRHDRKPVRKLVPFYVVSFYKKTKGFEGYERLPVRNRAHPTFLPPHDKFKDVKKQLANRSKLKRRQAELDRLNNEDISHLGELQRAAKRKGISDLENKIQRMKSNIERLKISDYQGYTFSLCLSEKEFLELTKGKQMDAGYSRELTELPEPFLHKYHKVLYKNKKEKLELALIQRKIDNNTSEYFEEPEMEIDGDDDPSLPRFDGLIHLKNGSSLDIFNDGFSIGNTCFDINGNVIFRRTLGLYYEDNQLFYATKRNWTIGLGYEGIQTAAMSGKFAFARPHNKINLTRDLGAEWITSCAIRSNHTFAYINAPRSDKAIFELWLCENIGWIKYRKKFISNVPRGTVLKWCGDILLVVVKHKVWGFDFKKSKMLVLEGHTQSITSVAVCDDMIATASKDNTLILWNTTTPTLGVGVKVLAKVRNKYRFGKTIKQIKKMNKDETPMYAVEVEIPNAKDEVGNFRCKASAHVKTLRGHANEVLKVVWCKHLISSSLDETVCIWRTSENIGDLLFRLDFRSLGLPRHVSSTREQSSYSDLKDLKDKSHLGTNKSVDLGVVDDVVVYYYDKIVGKLNPEKGTIIPFASEVLNTVNGLDTEPQSESKDERDKSTYAYWLDRDSESWSDVVPQNESTAEGDFKYTYAFISPQFPHKVYTGKLAKRKRFIWMIKRNAKKAQMLVSDYLFLTRLSKMENWEEELNEEEKIIAYLDTKRIQMRAKKAIFLSLFEDQSDVFEDENVKSVADYMKNIDLYQTKDLIRQFGLERIERQAQKAGLPIGEYLDTLDREKESIRHYLGIDRIKREARKARLPIEEYLKAIDGDVKEEENIIAYLETKRKEREAIANRLLQMYGPGTGKSIEEEYKVNKPTRIIEREKRWQADREKKWQAEKQKREQKELEDKANYWGMSVNEYLEKQKREQKELEEYLEKEKREQKKLEDTARGFGMTTDEYLERVKREQREREEDLEREKRKELEEYESELEDVLPSGGQDGDQEDFWSLDDYSDDDSDDSDDGRGGGESKN